MPKERVSCAVNLAPSGTSALTMTGVGVGVVALAAPICRGCGDSRDRTDGRAGGGLAIGENGSASEVTPAMPCIAVATRLHKMCNIVDGQFAVFTIAEHMLDAPVPRIRDITINENMRHTSSAKHTLLAP